MTYHNRGGGVLPSSQMAIGLGGWLDSFRDTGGKILDVVTGAEFGAGKSYVHVNGVCKPAKGPVADPQKYLNLHKEVQRQINRIMSVKAPNMMIAVDGDLGRLTFTAGRTAATVTGACNPPPSSCQDLANNPRLWIACYRQAADGINAPAKAPAPPATKPPTLVDAKTNREISVQAAGFTLGGVGPIHLAIGGVGAVLLYRHMKGGKTRRGRGRRRRRR